MDLFYEKCSQFGNGAGNNGNISEIQQAFDIANETNLNPEELADLEERERYILDQQGILRKGIEEGIAQGREQGIAQGKKVEKKAEKKAEKKDSP